jgi:tetratricopeptide (TPR) repeat protein
LESLAILDEAESLFGPSRILYHERAHLAWASRRGRGSRALPRAAGHYALGRAYLRDGDLRRAAEHLDRAVELDPQSLWHHFCRGVCADRRGQHEDALVAFSACVSLAPKSAACYFNRARAWAALGRQERALRDCEQAVRLDPEHRPAGELLARLRPSP